MSRFPPHAWHGAYGGYQPPDFLDPMLAGGPGFFDGPPMFPPPHHPFMGGGGGGGPPPFFGGGGGPPPGPPGDDDGHGFGGMPPPPPPHGFFPPHGPPPFRRGGGGGGGGFMAAPWMAAPGFGGGPNWHFGSDGDGDDDNDGSDGDAANPKTLPRRTGGGGRAGVGLIYNPKQTRLHVFRKTEIGPWKDGARRGVAVPARKMGGFNIWDADVGWSVRQLLEHLGKGDDAWAVSEVTEAGNGRWYKGSTIAYKDERAAETLSKQGWTERRGRGLGQAPVWLVLHKVE